MHPLYPTAPNTVNKYRLGDPVHRGILIHTKPLVFMRIKNFIAATALFLCIPSVAHAQATLTTEQAQIIGQCSVSLITNYQNHAISLEAFQFGIIGCYRLAGAADLIPAAYRTVTSTNEVQTLNDAAARAIDALWNSSDALRLNIPDLHTRLAAIQLTIADAQKINSCFEKLAPDLRGSTLPNASEQGAIADCYSGTPYESLLAPLYTKIATVIECGRDKLGVARLDDLARLVSAPTEKESAIISQCYVERTAPALSVIALTNVLATGGLRDTGLLVVMGLSNVWLVLRRRRTDKFGTVVNSLAKLPVDLAIVRLVSAETNRVVHSAVTDSNGRFFLFTRPGTYAVEVVKPGYAFPSEFAGTALSEAVHGDLLLEPRLTTDTATPVVQRIMPVDPIVQEPSVPREQWRRAGRRASAFIGLASPALGIGSALLTPKWWVVLLAAVNILLFFLFRYFAKRHSPRAFGTVTDSNNNPVANAIIRVFDTQYNKLVATAVSDSRGRYGCMAGPGAYLVTCEKQGVGKLEIAVIVAQNEQVITQKIHY